MAIKNKKALFATGALLIIIALIGGAIAYNQELFSFDNDFELGIFKTEVSETFDSPTNWTPCDETEKLVIVKNTGTMAAKARIKMEESWISKDGAKLGLVKDGVTLAQISLANDQWELIDGYYYLKSNLAPNQTVEFLRSVKLNCSINLGENEIVDGDGESVITTNEYNGASYHLKVTAQLMQADGDIAWKSAFGWEEPKTFAALASDFQTKWHAVKQGRIAKALKRSEVLPNASTVSNMTEVQASGETPVYLWYDTNDTTMYWYSTVDAISAPSNMSVGGFFQGAYFSSSDEPTDISGLEYFDTKNIQSLSGFFGGSLPDDMSPISHWDLSGVTSFSGVFTSSTFKEKHMSALAHWKFGDDVSFSHAFAGNSSITSLAALKEWDMSGATDLSSMFVGAANLSDINAISDWNVSNVTDFSSMFERTAVSSATILNGWHVSDAATLTDMFANTNCTDGTYPSWYTEGRR